MNSSICSNPSVSRPSSQFVRRAARLCHAGFAAATLLVTLSVSVSAGWGTNPAVSTNAQDAPYVMLPLEGSVGVAQMIPNTGIEIDRLNAHGNPAPPYSFYWYESGMNTDAPIAGCALSQSRFALVYNQNDGSVRVVAMTKQGSTYVVDPGFPVSIGYGGFFKVTPNLVSGGGSDGVWVAWQHVYGVGSNPPTEVRVQGVLHDGTLAYLLAPDGVRLQDSYGISLDSLSIVSDGAGLAIATYRVPDESYWTTKLDASAQVAMNMQVPGQSSGTVGDCFVVRDGTGGAFYCYSLIDAGQSMASTCIAQVRGNQSVPSTMVIPQPGTISLVRVLTAEAVPDNSVVVAFRNQTSIIAVRVMDVSSSGLLLSWDTFLSGATNDNSEEADAVLTSAGVAFAWTRFNVVKSEIFKVQDGQPAWLIPELTVSVGIQPLRPRIIRSPKKAGVPSSASSPGVIVGWNESNGILADRLRLADGSFGD